MPRIKIDYVVSFSSEDADNQARNLLSWDVSKKRWLCTKGESYCSVVLQLAKAVKISSVQIGAHHAALVEVLVGRSESPSEPFQVLVPSCVFLTPKESRSDQNVDKVRSFDSNALTEEATKQCWDRVRITCSQPYNKHCKYGISFIHIFEPEDAPAPAPAALRPRALPMDTFSSDEEEFRPGELFAQHHSQSSAPDTPDTGAQIRQATSLALRHNSDAATRLLKTPLPKREPAPSARAPPRHLQERDNDKLMYTKDDEKPHSKIDQILQRHKDEKARHEAMTPKTKEKAKETYYETPRSSKEESSTSRNCAGSGQDSGSERDKDKREGRRDRDNDRQNGNRSETTGSEKNGSRKRPHSDRNESGNLVGGGGQPGPVCAQPLRGVVFALSGYQNRERSALRDLAVSLGARYLPAWGAACTHLICAFPNTPKLREVRGEARGDAVPVCTGEWVRECARRERALPCAWYATEPARRIAPPPHSPSPPATACSHSSECDTDDEIEKAVRWRRQKAGRSSPAATGARSDDSDVAFVKNERMQGNVTVTDSDGELCTDTECPPSPPGSCVRVLGALPDVFAGRTFVLDEDVVRPFDRHLLARYLLAYGGQVLSSSQLDEDSPEHYVLCGSDAALRATASASTSASASRALRVRADWVWACHRAGRLCALRGYT